MGGLIETDYFFGNKIEYLTLPLVKGSDGLNIRDRLISEDWSSVSQKYKRKIALHYSNRKNFDQGMAFLKKSPPLVI